MLANASRIATVLLLSLLACPAGGQPPAGGSPTEGPQAEGPPAGAEWIWSPAYEQNKVPAGVCYFRRTFTIDRQLESAKVFMAADNRYELFVNGRSIGGGGDWRKMDSFDIAPHLRKGNNVIAVRAENTEAGPAGLVARVLVYESGVGIKSLSTDSKWRSSVNEFRNWNTLGMSDRDWLPAKSYGQLGAVLPWGNEVVLAAEGARFTLDPEFSIARVARDEQTGSIVAITFTAEGDLLVSQERGPLLLLKDKNGDGFYESKTVYSDKINTAQGILSLGKQVYAVGSGPEQGGVYRLVDNDGDGQAEEISTIVRVRGRMGEHGAHAIRLGPDGRLYIMIGNHVRANLPGEANAENANLGNPRETYRLFYEGDLVQPRYEDPRGHAVGIPAPGGTLLRTDLAGKRVEIVASGFRNAYDFAFNQQGELFTYDSDMEWDAQTPWYRPTRINYVPLGGEFGWRSGWAKWPDYWLDSLPAILPFGGGSPTGMEFYSHRRFPRRLQNTLLAADWAKGEIHAIKLRRAGGGYQASSSVFVKGRPMAVTDLAVGPGGDLFFSTGGRGTEGAVYRVSWKGQTPEAELDLGEGIDRALRTPQLEADWARRQISTVRQSLGQQWGSQLTAAANDARRPADERQRAIELMSLYGPRSSVALLGNLARDQDASLRLVAARYLQFNTDPAATSGLTQLLGDPDAAVRRQACESLVLHDARSAAPRLVALLGDGDRWVRFAARRALESIDANVWRDAVLRSSQADVFLNGSVGLLTAAPNHELALAIAQRLEQMIRGQLAPRAYLDLLRVAQLAITRGQLATQEITGLRDQLFAEYPTTDALMNRELVRLLVHLQTPGLATKLANQLQSDIDPAEKFQVAAYASRLNVGWTTPEKLALLRYYESARDMQGGASLAGYMESFARSFFTNLSLAECRQVLAAGERFPTSSLSILAQLPDDPGQEILSLLRELDARIDASQDDRLARMQVGVIAVLAKTGDAESAAYLRKVYAETPSRRAPVAMALTQHPEGDNWPVLIDALGTLEGVAAQEVLAALGRVRVRPSESKPYRNVILQGLDPTGAGPQAADRLLTYWIGQPGEVAQATSPAARMAAWQKWYAASFPNQPPAVLPTSTVANRWSYEELLSYLNSEPGQAGDVARGEKQFTATTCIKCHRHGSEGETLGPDLTTLARRFQTKEVLQSIVYPSHVVSDLYPSKTVVVDGRAYTGIAVEDGPNHVVVLTDRGDRRRFARDDIEEIRNEATSAMPEGLLNKLTLAEVADLFAFLMNDPQQ